MRASTKNAVAAHARKYRGTGMVGEILKVVQQSEGMSLSAIADSFEHDKRGSVIKTVHRLKGDGRLLGDAACYTVATQPITTPAGCEILAAMQQHARSLQS